MSAHDTAACKPCRLRPLCKIAQNVVRCTTFFVICTYTVATELNGWPPPTGRPFSWQISSASRAVIQLAGCHRRQNVIQYTHKKGRQREGSPGAAPPAAESRGAQARAGAAPSAAANRATRRLAPTPPAGESRGRITRRASSHQRRTIRGRKLRGRKPRDPKARADAAHGRRITNTALIVSARRL